jgi:phosphoribosylglycinamide formyltransferase-1
VADKIRIGVLISGSGTNLQAILDASDEGSLCGEVVFIGSDNPNASGQAHGRKRGIPAFVVDYSEIIRECRSESADIKLPRDFNLEELREKQTLFPPSADQGLVTEFLTSRAIAENRLLAAMANYPFDLLVLAGFMRTLTPYFIDRVNVTPGHPRIMNIHPSLLPAFPGTDGYGDTFRFGCKVAGCTVHYIDYGEDTGPIIGQMAFPIESDDTLETVRAKGLELEWKLYPECINLFAQGRLITEKISNDVNGVQKVERTVVRILAPAQASSKKRVDD